MRLIVGPCRGAAQGRWRWDLFDEDTGEVLCEGTEHATPQEARAAAHLWRNRVYLTPVELGT